MEVSPQGLPSRTSSRYFAYSAALSDVPRAVSRTKRGSRAATRSAISRILGAPSSRMRRSTAGCSAISPDMIRPGVRYAGASRRWTMRVSGRRGGHAVCLQWSVPVPRGACAHGVSPRRPAGDDLRGGPSADAGGAVGGDVQRPAGRRLRHAHLDHDRVGPGGDQGVQCVGHPAVPVHVAYHCDDPTVTRGGEHLCHQAATPRVRRAVGDGRRCRAAAGRVRRRRPRGSRRRRRCSPTGVKAATYGALGERRDGVRCR